MFRAVKIMSILLAANMEAILLVFLAWWLGKKLDLVYPLDGFSWLPISFAASTVLISYSWWVIVRATIKNEKK